MSQSHLQTIFSPTTNQTLFSLHAVLGVIAAGSRGQTLDQLLGFLKTNTVDDLNTLASKAVSVFTDGSPSGGPRLSLANGVWVEKTLSMKQSFKQVVDTVYNAASNHVDFKNKAVEVANEVNEWAEKQTNGLIKDILPSGSVDSSTRLIFANAVYFKGAWSEKFDQSRTKEYAFFLLDGSNVQVPFMTSSEKQFVCEYDGFKVLGLPYLPGEDKRRFTMYFYLPDAKDGLPSLIEKIGSRSDSLDRYIPRDKVDLTWFSIPKFKISFGFEASDTLKELGLVLPFGGGEGLTEMVGLSACQNLYVSSILHKSFVEFHEEGTKAAAASRLKLRTLAGRRQHEPYEFKFVADHPFLFVIREDVSGIVLFMGQVLDPSVS